MTAFPSWSCTIPEPEVAYKKNTRIAEKAEKKGKKLELEINERQHAVGTELQDAGRNQPKGRALERKRQPFEALAERILAREIGQLHGHDHDHQGVFQEFVAGLVPTRLGFLGRNAEGALRAAGVQPRTDLEIGSREAIREALARGLGLGAVSEAEFIADPRFVPVRIAGEPASTAT